jgi:monoamine oxidase
MTDKPKIAIIGSGLAGLTAALRLDQKNYQIEVYEARRRVGGRVFTALMKNAKDDYLAVELGGQNIADGDRADNILNLARQLDLEIATESITISSLVYFEKKYQDFNQLLLQLNFPPNKIDEIVDNAALNSVSILEVINKLFENNALAKMVFSSRLKTDEGLDVSKQSIYHNIDTLKCMLKGGISMAHQAYNHEQYSIKTIAGGNAKLPLKIAEILDKKIHLGKALVKVTKQQQQIKLCFSDDSEAICDKLLLAIPASTYCNIKFDDNIIPEGQLSKISNLQYGSNYKILLPAEYGIINYKSVISDKGISFFNDHKAMMVMYLSEDLEDFDQEIAILNNDNLKVKIPIKAPIKATDYQMIKYDNAITHSWSSDFYAKGSYCGYDTILANQLNRQINYQGIMRLSQNQITPHS